jgi:hypothetical protein
VFREGADFDFVTNILLRMWRSESSFDSYMAANNGAFLNQDVLATSSSIVLDAEVGVYKLSWNLDLSWHVGTDLIQSTTLTGSKLLLETDSGTLRLNLKTGELLP